MQMPNQVYVYSPDGESEGWYYSNEVPEGWVRSDPKAKAAEEAAKGETHEIKEPVAETAPEQSEPEAAKDPVAEQPEATDPDLATDPA